MTDISIIIVNYNGNGFIQGCLLSIKERLIAGSGSLDYEVIVLDNASSDDSPGFIEGFCREYHSFRLIKNEDNLGFGAACNIGARQSRGKFLLFLNPDCRLVQDGMADVLGFYLKNENTGCVGARILNKDGSLQLSCRAFLTLARQFYESFFLYRIFRKSRIFGSYFMTWWDHGAAREVDWLSGSFLLVKKAVFEESGGFDRGYFMYSEDADLCLRMVRSGLRNYYFPGYAVEHADAAIASRDMAEREAQVWESRRLYFFKNYSKAHASVFSFIYALGKINRIILYSIAWPFSAGVRRGKKIPIYTEAFRIYYGRKYRRNR